MPQYSSMNGIELNASTATRSPGCVPSSSEHGVEALETGEEVAVGEPSVARHQRLAIARDAYRSTQRMDERVHPPSIAHCSRIASGENDSRAVIRTR